MSGRIEILLNYDPQIEVGAAFPSTTDFSVFKGENYEWWLLHGSGAPSTNHNAAPLGSKYLDYSGSLWWRKTGATAWTLMSA